MGIHENIRTKDIAIATISSATLLLSGCAHGLFAGDAAAISYHLPRTVAVATLSATLTDCGVTGPQAEATLTLAADAEAGPQRAIWGSQLASARVARELTVETFDSGIIKSVNSTVVDMTPEIIGNVLKIALGAATMAATAGPPVPECQISVKSALKRAKVLTEQITALRDTQSKWNRGGKISDPAAYQKVLAALTDELAALRAGPLRIDVVARVPLPDNSDLGQGGLPIQWPIEPFGKFFVDPTREQIDAAFPARLFATARLAPFVDPQSPAAVCATGMKLPGPAHATLFLRGGQAIGEPGLGSTVSVPVQQWGTERTLCFDTGFGGNRTVQVDYDRFGRTTKLVWNSKATGVAASAAFAGYGEQLGGFIKAHKGASAVERQKAEIDSLETLQKLNRLRACQEILARGGSTCPAEAEPE